MLPTQVARYAVAQTLIAKGHRLQEAVDPRSKVEVAQ
jgi:hypothetical protein